MNDSFRLERERFFNPLYQEFGLSDVQEIHDEHFASVSAAAGNVRVFFEYERGLCLFSIGASAALKPLTAVQTLAKRFPRQRALEGDQRLSLTEQREFVQSKWSDLQVMFSPEHIRETTKWRDADAAALTSRYERKK